MLFYMFIYDVLFTCPPGLLAPAWGQLWTRKSIYNWQRSTFLLTGSLHFLYSVQSFLFLQKQLKSSEPRVKMPIETRDGWLDPVCPESAPFLVEGSL